MYAIMDGYFPICCLFFSVALSECRCIFALEPSSSSSDSFFNVIYPFGYSVMFVAFPYFTPKLFCFLCIWLPVYLPTFPTLQIIFSLYFWNVLFCVIVWSCLGIFLCLPSFANTFRFITSSFIVSFTCCLAYLFLFQHISEFFLP